MVKGATEKSRQFSHMMTTTQEGIPYCSPSTSSGKQKKARSTSQPQFRNENSPATNEADQILLAFNNWRRTAIQSFSTTISTESRNCLIPHNNNAHIWWKIGKVRTIWRPIPKEFENPQSADERRHNKLFPLPHAWWCSTDFQKHH